MADKPSERHADRRQQAKEGFQYLLGGSLIGIPLLALIGWLFPAWEVTNPVFFVCAVLSLGVMLATAMGAWTLIKALFHWQ